MRQDIKLLRIIGIQISIDYSWFIIFALVAWSLAQGYFPYFRPGLTIGSYWFMGLLSSLLLFISVLLHELSHSYAAKRLGIEIKEITLFIFGGVAQLSREPEKAGVELKIAIAGPMASIALAIIFSGLARGLSTLDPSSIFIDIFRYTYIINIVLAVFNLIPGFPLDGGRVLRAIWWWKTKDFERATHVASNAGKAVSSLLIFFGIIQILRLNIIGGVWAILIGMFLRQAAEGSYQQVVIKKILWGIRVKEIMTKDPIVVDSETPISRVVEEYFFRHPYVSYPVVKGGRVIGLLTLQDIRMIPREEWGRLRAGEVVKGLEEDTCLHPDDRASEALEKMMNLGRGRLLVVEGGRLVGIVTRRDIMKLLEVRRTFGG